MVRRAALRSESQSEVASVLVNETGVAIYANHSGGRGRESPAPHFLLQDTQIKETAMISRLWNTLDETRKGTMCKELRNRTGWIALHKDLHDPGRTHWISNKNSCT